MSSKRSIESFKTLVPVDEFPRFCQNMTPIYLLHIYAMKTSSIFMPYILFLSFPLGLCLRTKLSCSHYLPCIIHFIILIKINNPLRYFCGSYNNLSTLGFSSYCQSRYIITLMKWESPNFSRNGKSIKFSFMKWICVELASKDNINTK